MSKMTIVGCGVVGSSWALVFARAGFDVSIYDASTTAQEDALAFVRDALKGSASKELAAAETVEATLGRLTLAVSLEDALAGSSYVQESAPERVELKRELYKRLDTIAAPDTILASSTSGLPASSFTEDLPNAHRCLVVHPINPPHLIPLVEIVPAPWTTSSVVDRAADIMRQVGQSPIKLTREINGFVVNRLQSAILGEAFRLVQDGICNSTDVDKAVSEGLGLRWFFMGPFETIDLNAQNGVAEYCANLGAMYHGLALEQADPRKWDEMLVRRIEKERRTTTPVDQLAARRAWRDRYLADLISTKRRLNAEQSE